MRYEGLYVPVPNRNRTWYDAEREPVKHNAKRFANNGKGINTNAKNADVEMQKKIVRKQILTDRKEMLSRMLSEWSDDPKHVSDGIWVKLVDETGWKCQGQLSREGYSLVHINVHKGKTYYRRFEWNQIMWVQWNPLPNGKKRLCVVYDRNNAQET